MVQPEVVFFPVDPWKNMTKTFFHVWSKFKARSSLFELEETNHQLGDNMGRQVLTTAVADSLGASGAAPQVEPILGFSCGMDL